MSNQIALQYLYSRGITKESIDKFQIGYATGSNDTINYLRNNFFDLKMAKELGIIDSGSNGLYARFIERITFPIFLQSGKLVGFGGRTISGHNANMLTLLLQSFLINLHCSLDTTLQEIVFINQKR